MFIWEQVAAFFKGLFTGFLALIVAVSNYFGWYIDVGGVHGLRADYAYTFAYSTEKIQPNDILGKRDTIRVTMGKNEREGFQLIFRVRYKNEVPFVVELSDITGPGGAAIPASVFKESYIFAGPPMGSGVFPDALIPYGGGREVVSRRVNQGFYIELRTGAATPVGIYNGTVSVRKWENVGLYEYAAGETLVEAPFSVEVLDVTYPDAAYSDTAMGIFCSQFYAINGVEYGNTALYKQYYDFLLDHKISAYDLPYDILDSRADAYMSDPRVRTFQVPYPGDDGQLQAYFDKVQSNPDWARKAFFYPIDEPGTAANIQTYNAMTDRLATLCPGYHMVTPFYTWKFSDGGAEYDNLAIQNGRSDIICPISNLFDKDGFPAAVAGRVAGNGDRAWWYVCCGPTGDYNNMFIHLQGTRHRLLFWQQYQQGLTGLLYWDTVYWDKSNPWLSSATWDSYESSGDGSWFYPGRTIGLDEPVPSLRLKNIADGLEDYDLLRMAEAKLGRDYCLGKAGQLSAALTSYTRDPEKLEKIRVEIMRDLAK